MSTTCQAIAAGKPRQTPLQLNQNKCHLSTSSPQAPPQANLSAEEIPALQSGAECETQYGANKSCINWQGKGEGSQLGMALAVTSPCSQPLEASGIARQGSERLGEVSHAPKILTSSFLHRPVTCAALTIRVGAPSPTERAASH